MKNIDEPAPLTYPEMGSAVADHVTATLAYWDNNLICRYANATFSEWFGKTREEMIGKMTLRDLLGPQLYEKNAAQIKGVMAGVKQTFVREMMTPAGNTRHTLVNYIPDTENGITKGFFVHAADISASKRLEKEIQLSNRIIRAQNERLVNYTSIVSHDLRSYANNLKSILDILENAKSEEEKAEMFRFLRRISEKFSSTVQNLGEIAKTQQGSAIAMKQIHLHDMVNRLIDLQEVEIRAKNAVVHNNIAADVSLNANPAILDSIVQNFITNALKYYQPGRPPVVELNSTVQDKELILEIKDNGRGIDLQQYGKDLFGMNKTFHGNADAQGIGLFITKLHIESMNGWIETQSKVGEGTTFRVHFNLG